jgi:hypothetical protein
MPASRPLDDLPGADVSVPAAVATASETIGHRVSSSETKKGVGESGEGRRERGEGRRTTVEGPRTTVQGPRTTGNRRLGDQTSDLGLGMSAIVSVWDDPGAGRVVATTD